MEGDRTATISAHSIARAFVAADELFGASVAWGGNQNKDQEYYFGELHERCCADSQLIPELTGSATSDVGDIKKLSRADVSRIIGLTAEGKLDVLVKWDKGGNPVKEQIYGVRTEAWYPGVQITKASTNFSSSPLAREGIVSIATQSRYEVLMTKADKPLAGMELYRHVAEIHKSQEFGGWYAGVRFPMVDFREKFNLDWLVGLSGTVGSGSSASGFPVGLTESEQENRLSMDHVGARVVSRTTHRMVLYGCSAMDREPPWLVIDEPFYFWLVFKPTSGVYNKEIPLFVGYIMEDDWKEPASLEGD